MTTTFMDSDFLHADKIEQARPSDFTGVLEAAKTFKAGLTGGFRAKANLQEAFTTADFPKLLAPALGIEALDLFRAHTPEWQGIVDTAGVPDFTEKPYVGLHDLDEFDDVAQGEEYKGAPLTETGYKIQVGKTGRAIGLTWELNLSRNWSTLAKLPQRLASAARRTEDAKVFGCLIDPRGGPSKTLFTGPSAPTRLPLTYDNLLTALGALRLRKGEDGQLIDVDRFTLVVHPALKTAAEAILNITEVQTTQGGTATKTGNGVRASIASLVAPRALAKYDTANKAETTWYLLPEPGSTTPAIAKVSLDGHEEPDLRVSNTQGLRAGGGGPIDPMQGSFKDDTIWYRGRHVTGGAALMPYAVYASQGS
ncbi:Mu-like prophage major head subunit gpT family protein [Rothia sp. AR01]|uniref:Mu-like prophage major head subunit gpT family protein n=1 Tax=Rothia santali TaxID=2949643 RepID=A0A9X2KHN1_9MICC|nr:Mu-like prophage major head subunit gpT family protein [Rothia santali]MCP3426022.1 Mu-like prophage major head subunit gpT family protein [Rothia santali]